tara:strand:- start:268 stop:879 length:612 start_codon:yes stop_codon:yes gene_type:complete
MKVLDLCSGLGGFSEAFLNCPSWEVMRIENNPLLSEVPNTEIMDVIAFRDNLHDMISRGYEPIYPELILASPPCREFSLGYASPRSIASREGTLEHYKPNLEILFAVMDIIKMLKPRFFIIENVKGSIRYFEEHLGQPRCSHGSFWFYGNFPLFEVNEPLKNKSKNDKGSKHPLRVQYRALIPLPISKSIKNAIECQTSLFNF